MKGLVWLFYLRHLLAPHFLARERKDVFKSENHDGEDKHETTKEQDKMGEKKGLTARMNDFIVWLPLTEVSTPFISLFFPSR